MDEIEFQHREDIPCPDCGGRTVLSEPNVVRVYKASTGCYTEQTVWLCSSCWTSVILDESEPEYPDYPVIIPFPGV